MKQYLVIGLGRFGTGVAKTLYEAEKNVLAIDIDEELVQEKIDANILKNAVIGDPSDEKVLKDIGAENFDVAFICIADIEASVMIALNLKELGVKITEDFKNENEPLIVVGLLKGSMVFMADLIRQIKLPLEIDFLEASSYGEGTQTSREVKILKDLRSTISGKNVLVVEDIIDSGFTLKKVLQILGSRNPKKISLCTLLDKPERREVEVDVQYVGFEIPNEFVVGYGLDFNENYRNLEYIGVAESSVFE